MIKAYYVFRRDLKLSPSKLAVQVGHGTQYLVLKASNSFLREWMQGSDSRKIICEAKDMDHLIKLTSLLRSKGVDVESIVDSGYTEVDPFTQTGIAFFIDDETVGTEVCNKVRRLQLYKDIQFAANKIAEKVAEETGMQWHRCKLDVDGTILYGEYESNSKIVKYSRELWRGGYQYCYDLNFLKSVEARDGFHVPNIKIIEVYP